MLHILHSQQMWNILLETLTSLEAHMSVNINPSHYIHKHLALLSLGHLRSWIRRFLKSPAVVHRKRLGAIHVRPHSVDRRHYGVPVATTLSRGKIEETDLRGADFAISPESRGYIVRWAEGNVEDYDFVYVFDKGFRDTDVGLVVAIVRLLVMVENLTDL